jgi:hypothetical protein
MNIVHRALECDNKEDKEKTKFEKKNLPKIW